MEGDNIQVVRVRAGNQNPKNVSRKELHIAGNNAQPIKEGRCCDYCNDTKVLPERFRRLNASRKGVD